MTLREIVREKATLALVTIIAVAVSGDVAADSVMRQVTKSNIEDQPFVFEVECKRGEDLLQYRVFVKPRTEREDWCVSASLLVMEGERQIARVPVGPSMANEDGWRWVYAFAISPDNLEGSKFTFFDSELEMPSFDGYWFDLAELAED